MFNGFYEALLVLAGYLLIIWSSAIFWSRVSWGVGWGFPIGGIFVVDFLGMVVRTGGYVLSVPLTIIVKIALEQTAGGKASPFC